MCEKCDQFYEKCDELLLSRTGRIKYGDMLLTLARILIDDLESHECKADRTLISEMTELATGYDGVIVQNAATDYLARLVGENGWPIDWTKKKVHRA